MINRNIQPQILQALSDSPVVLLNGARQTGKSTLVKELIAKDHPARYLTLDDAAVLTAAQSDPAGFLEGLDGNIVIDEVQRAPELFLAIKADVDRQRRTGRFLLTGSADILLLPRLAESLAGRMEILTLWPFSQGEIEGVREGFIDASFGEKLPVFSSSLSRDEIFTRILTGGYPELLERKNEERRRAWFGSYVTTILQRDVRDLANIEGLTSLPRLLGLLAARATATVNLAEVSRATGIAHSTLRRYLTLLEATFLIHNLPPWFTNIGKRLVKSPKLLVCDTGLMSYELGIDHERLALDPNLTGPLLENFVAVELLKQSAWSRKQPKLFHLRTQSGEEVDLILEAPNGKVVGIEVKASASIDSSDFKGLRLLGEALGTRFARGIVLYTGLETVPFSPRLHAVPISALWHS
ncbi:MAG TPA: ATP-binding protein [Blastocatellia bacterium]|nr:ATP-binding protein [Blastocatellia bacterium]